MYSFAKFCYVCINNTDNLQCFNSLNNDNLTLLKCLFKSMWPSKNNMYICSKCLSNLQEACDFINKCRNSYKLLQGYAHQLNRNDSSTGKPTDLIDLFDEESSVTCNNLDSAVVVKIESTEILNSLLNNCDKDCRVGVNSSVIEDSHCSGSNSPELNFVDIKSNEYFNTDTVQEVIDKNPLENVNQELDYPEDGSVFNVYDSNLVTKEERLETNLVSVKKSVKKSNGDKNRHICPVCNKTFRRKTRLLEHSIAHSDARPYPCGLCGKAFKADSHLRNHKLTHSGVKRHKCNLCDKAFYRSSNLQLHRRTHSNVRPHKCSVCDMRFKEKGTLRKHMSVHSAIKTIKCTFCEKEFNRADSLKKHLRTHTGERPYECTECDKRFSEKGTLNKHMNTHSGYKQFKCQLCDKEYSRLENLKLHMKTHTEYRPYKCTKCEKSFMEKAILYQHMTLHSPCKFKCFLCDDEFTRSDDLKTHLLVTHSGEAPHECALCNKKYKTKCNLNKHMKTHGANEGDNT